MNARCLNHLRGLFPVVTIGTLLVLSCLWLEENNRGSTAASAYVLFCLMVGVTGFGLELSHNVHLPMLAQPVARQTLWLERMLVTAGAMMLPAAAFVSVLLGMSVFYLDDEFRFAMILIATLTPLAALGFGGPATALVRQLQSAFWLSLFFAAILAVLIHALWPKTLPGWEFRIFPAVYGALSVLGLLWGRRLFLEYQDHLILNRDLAFPWARASAANETDSTTARTRRNATISLIRKELGLQQVNFIVFMMALLIGALIRISSEHAGLAIMKDLVSLVGPFMIGAVAVAEERRLGLAAWRLTQPPARLTQWLVKTAVCVGLSLALWLLLRVIPEWLAPTWARHGLLATHSKGQLAGLAVFEALLGLLASSSSRGYLQSMAILFLYVFVLRLLDSIAVWWIVPPIGHVPPSNLFRFIGIPLLAGYGLFQAYRNYVSIESTGRLIVRTVAGALVCLGATFVITGLVYNRTWELLERRPLRSQTFAKEGAQEFLNGLVAGFTIDPQGRLWRLNGAEKIIYRPTVRPPSREVPELSQIGSDSDWKQVVGKPHYGFGALKEDGTLWAQAFGDWDRFLTISREKGWAAFAWPDELTEITPGRRWIKFQQNRFSWLGLKADGTIWRWGGNGQYGLGLEDRSIVWSEPRQMGTSNDWVDIMQSPLFSGYIALKRDGTVWQWGYWSEYDVEMGDFVVVHRPEPKRFEPFAPFEIVEARVLSAAILGRLKDERVVVATMDGGAFRPGWEYAAQGVFEVLPEDLKTKTREPQRDVWMLKPEIDWQTLSLWIKPASLTHDGRIVTRVRHDNDLPVLSYNEYGGDWIAYAYDWRTWEAIGLKSDGGFWKWRYPDYPNEQTFGTPTWNSFLHTQSKKLLPGRFRPERVGFLDLSQE